MADLAIGTRRSPLALWQAEHVRDALMAAHPGLEVRLVPIVTQGDKILDVPLAQVGGKALFVKEIEDRLLAGEIDLAVHSLKDVPAELPEGLALVATGEREDPRDAFVARDPKASPRLAALPQGAKVGTSSLRRTVQLKSARPDLETVAVRGNVGTRLEKLESEGLDALVLATAGLLRLGLAGRITERLDPEACLPAIGQGALALEAREGDASVGEIVAPFHHQMTHHCVVAERAFLARLGGGCQVPVAGYAILEDGALYLRGLVGTLDGRRVVRGEERGPPDEGADLGARLAERLLEDGGREILAALLGEP